MTFSADPSKWSDAWWRKRVQTMPQFREICDQLKANRKSLDRIGKTARDRAREKYEREIRHKDKTMRESLERARELRERNVGKGKRWFHGRPTHEKRFLKPFPIQFPKLRRKDSDNFVLEGPTRAAPDSYKEMLQLVPSWNTKQTANKRKHNALETLQLKTSLKKHGKCQVQLRHELSTNALS